MLTHFSRSSVLLTLPIYRGREFRTIVINLTWSEFYANSFKAFSYKELPCKICATKAKIPSKATSAKTRRNSCSLSFLSRQQQTHDWHLWPGVPSTFLTLCSPRHRLPPPRREDLACSRCSEYTHVIVGEWRVRPLTLAGVRESVAGWPVMSWQHRVLRWRAFRRPLRRAVACPGEAGPRS